MSASMNRLSTGLRINTAREDAAGMAIANKLSYQLVGLERASDNSQHGISLIQTAEGALNEVHAMLQRMRELAVQAANDTNVAADRMAIQNEINDLTDEITALAGRAEFNTIKLLNGEAARVATSWVESISGNNLLTRVIANPMFISENVPAGRINYRVTAPSQPARIVGTMTATDFNQAQRVGTTGTMLINGISVDVNEGDTVGDVWERIVYASTYAGMLATLPIPQGMMPNPAYPGDPTAPPQIPDPDGQQPQNLQFTSVRNGEHERLELGGNAALWRYFGIYLPAESYARTHVGGPNAPIDMGDAPPARVPNPAFNPNLPVGETNQRYIPDPIWDEAQGFNGIITVGSGLTPNGEPDNRWPITIREGMSMRDIFEAIYDAGNVNRNIHRNYGVASWEVEVGPVYDDGGALVLPEGEWRIIPQPPNIGPITLTADSEMVNASGDTVDIDIWGIFGIVTDHDDAPGSLPAPSASRPALTAHGRDVQITDVHMVDPNGRPIADFNNGMAISTNGNLVTITSIQGQRIEMNVHVPMGYRSGDDNDAGNVWGADGPQLVRLQVDDGTGTMVDAYDDNGTPIYILEDVLEMQLRIEAFGGLRVQIGPNYNMNMDIQIPRLNAETLGLVEYRAGQMVRLLQYTTQEGASRAIDQMDFAIQRVSRVRGRLGAYQNRLEHTIRNLDNAALNTEAARSRIQDTDMAREMTLLSKRNVMYQAGLSILGQANQRPQMVLQLLQ